MATTKTGTNNKDTINGTAGDDIIYALDANDLVVADAGNDIVDGGAGNDNIDGGLGNDTLFGGLGNDTITDTAGSNTAYGGAGNDNIALSGAAANVIYGDGYNSFTINGKKLTPTDLVAAPGADNISGGSGGDTIYGDNGNNLSGNASGGADVIHGNGGADTLYGEGGNDQLFGDEGNDQLLGGAGADSLMGGDGADILTGGSGNDVFVYGAASESTAVAMDVITDFVQGQDKIDLTALIGATDLKWGGLNTPTANGAWYTQSGGNTFVFADTDGDAAPDLKVQLNGSYNLAITDFLGVSNVINQAPLLNSVALVISEGGTVALTAGDISITDPDSSSFTFTVSGVTHGRFELNSNAGAAITSFSSAQVAAGSVRFVHDGGEIAPSFSIKANDGLADSNTVNGSISFSNLNDVPILRVCNKMT